MTGTAPHFSIITPVYNPPIGVLDEAVQSVRQQRYEDWELILVDDCSDDPGVVRRLRHFAAQDSRIRLIEREVNGHIVAASNDGLAAATGEFVAFLDQDDVLATTALGAIARRISQFDDVDYIYSDEDLVLEDGTFAEPFAKPDWSPERLRAQNYCNHFSVMRRELVRGVGGFRDGFDGAQDHDLVLRVTEKARRIEHVSQVLYHWRVSTGSAAADAGAKPYALEAGRRAIEEHLERVGVGGAVEIEGPGHYRVRRDFPARRKVSIVIPTRGTSALVWGRRRPLIVEAVRSALEKTGHRDIEVIVVYDLVTPGWILDSLRAIAGERLVLVPFSEKFDYSRKVNIGVLASSGDRLIILNDDVEVRSEKWVEELLAPLEERDVGMTGAKLYFSSTAIQHAGLALSRGRYMHPWRSMPGDTPGKARAARINREVSGVTGACVGIRRATYIEVGGLTELLAESFNDVDLSYKIARAGYRTLLMAYCELFHFESRSREPTPFPDELRFVRDRWGIPGRDRYTPTYPNLPRTRAQVRQQQKQQQDERIKQLGPD